MKHIQFEEWLQLSFYNELTEQEQTLLNGHLATCEKCRNELGDLKKLHVTLVHRPLPVPGETVLQDARRMLRLRIHTEGTQNSFWTHLKDVFDKVLSPPAQLALGGAATLAVGIVIGYFSLQSSSDNTSGVKQIGSMSSVMDAGESQVTNIRFLDRDTQTGNIEFTFETITPVHIRGNVNDERVQKMLARALVSNQNAGTRLRAVNMIGTQSDQKQNGLPELAAEVKAALITTLLHDHNLGVRKEALNVLKNYLPDLDIVRAFLGVLANEKSTGLKIAAINSLDLSKYGNQPVNQEILEMFKQKAQSDDNNYIRIKAKAALQEVRQ